LTDELLAAGVQPWVTLFHWDFPTPLYLAGGWLNRDSSNWFAEYTRVVVDRLSDRVRHWITLNEPQIYIGLGHWEGKHAPGLKLSFEQSLLAGHHTMMAHGRSVQVIRATAKKPALVGWAPVGRVEYPATDSQADIDAARASTMSVDKKNFWSNTWFGDAAIFGRYPEDGLKLFGAEAPKPKAGDMELIGQRLDFYGLNIYSGGRVKAGDDGKPTPVWLEPGHARNALSWAVAPESLRWGPRFIAERYKLPVLVTENGMSNLDWVHSDGAVHDPQRIDFTRRYLIELRKAIEDGADIRGYFHWSIMDNFEWAEGYKDRFGLIHVDYTTQKRTLKDSAHWYAEVIASNGGVLDTPHAGLEKSVFVYEGAAV
jgi:beta-glucosidase